MKTLRLLGLGLLMVGTFSACKKDDPVATVNNNVGSTKEMVVPASFDYSTTRNLSFDITSQHSWGKEKVRLDIYDFNPTGGGSIIQSKFLEANGTLRGTMVLPNVVGKVYAVLNYPDGSSVMQSVEVQGGSVSYDFSTVKRSRKTAPVSPNCTSGCGTVVNNNNNWYNADNGGVYCFTGNTKSGITAKNGSTVRICGTGNFQMTVETGAKVEIVDGANVTITNFGVNNTADRVVIYPSATVDVKNWASPNSTVINYGTITFASLGIDGSCDFTNYGSMTVSQNQWHTVSGTFENNGTAYYGGNLTLNSTGSITNNCSLTVKHQLGLDATFQNNGFVDVEGLFKLNSTGKMYLNNSSMVRAEDMYLDGVVEGVGSTSLIKLNDNMDGNSTGRIQGNLELCDANGVEPGFTGQIVFPASVACNAYIPTSACNAVGNGTPQIADGDNDGVADDVDQYPNDPDASGASYYPASGQFATIAFEDLWPSAGDYDFNDLVVDYNYTMVTNASNNIVRIEAKFATKAIGAGLTNGFGVQLGCAPNAVQSVTGTLLTQNFVSVSANGTEQGQSKATVVIFDNAFKTIKDVGGTKFVNTISTEASKTADTLEVVITFTSPISEAQLGQAPFNPFLIVGGNRGKEVHLADYMPTDLADQNFFGTGNDDSQPGNNKYYKSEKNHPWALNVMSGFDYPEEKNDIVTAYNFFAAWAQSGGASNNDWYVDISGYRNTSKIY